MSYTVSHSIIDTLAAYWVKYIFGIPWDAVDSVLDAVRIQEQIQFVQVRHEESWALACSAYGKLTGELSVCMWTSWPWAIHLLNGLYDAKVDRSPVLAITWQCATKLHGSDFFQEIDHIKLFDDVAVFNQMAVSAEQFPRLIADACKAAIIHQWVAHINIPIDISMLSIPKQPIYTFGHTRQTTAPHGQLQQAAELIDSASKVMFLIGRWSRAAGDEIMLLAEKLHAPVIHALPAKDVAIDHPYKCGGCGLLGTPAGDAAMQWCDMIVMIGTSFPYSSFYPHHKVKSIQIDLNPWQIHKRYPVDIWLVWHAKEIVWSLVDMVEQKSDTSFVQKVQKSREKRNTQELKKEQSSAELLKPQRLAKTVWALADDDAIFVVDTGAVTVRGARNIHMRGTQRFSVSANLGTMAYSMSWAIGAAFAYPDQQVIALSGDGSMGMLMGDFITAVAHDLNIKIVVFNNAKLGLIQMEQEVHGMPEYMTALDNPDYAKFAECCGGVWYTVHKADELEWVLTTAFAHTRAAIINVHIDGEELTVPPSINLKQAMWFAQAKAKEVFGKWDKKWGIWVLVDMVKQLF